MTILICTMRPSPLMANVNVPLSITSSSEPSGTSGATERPLPTSGTERYSSIRNFASLVFSKAPFFHGSFFPFAYNTLHSHSLHCTTPFYFSS